MAGFGKHDRQYNEGAVQLGVGFEGYGGRDGSLVDNEIYQTVTASASLGNSGGYKSAVISDGSGRVFGATANAQQGGYNGAEMDEAMNNDMTGVVEAGYADKIATGIDRVQGDFSTLSPEMKELFISLRHMVKSEGIDLERTFQDAGGTRFGTVSKRIFASALCIAFTHKTFSTYELDQIVANYGCGEEDVFNGGKQQVAWRDFVNDVLSADVYKKTYEYSADQADTDQTDTGFSDGIATGIDKIAGGWDDLPLDVQQLCKDLRKMAKVEGINLEYSLQQAGGTRFGTIGRRHFLSALTIAFQHYTFTPAIYRKLADCYQCGKPDYAERMNGNPGALEEIAWRDFCNDVLSSSFDEGVGVQKILLNAKYDPTIEFNKSALAGVFES
jgi:hypothetical protein